MIYFDYAATTPVCEEALATLNESFKDDFANPHAAYSLAKNLNTKLDTKRKELLAMLGAKDGDQIVFTSSATEANNMALQGLPLKEGMTILNTLADHPSTVKVVEYLATKYKVVHFPLSTSGKVDKEVLANLISDEVGLVVLTHVNNVNGIITPIEELSKIIKEKNKKCHIHVDAVQSFGKISINLKNSDIDSLVISSHKAYGPKGCAALYLKKGVEIRPLLIGGGQEGGLRSSTVAFPLVNAFLSAAKWCLNDREEKLQQAKKWNLWLREELSKIHPNIHFPFSHDDTSPYIIGMLFKGISSDILLRHFEMKEIYISSSSACSSKIKGQNPTYDAMGIPANEHKFFMRLSFGEMTTSADFEKFVQAFSTIVEDIKMLIK